MPVIRLATINMLEPRGVMVPNGSGWPTRQCNRQPQLRCQRNRAPDGEPPPEREHQRCEALCHAADRVGGVRVVPVEGLQCADTIKSHSQDMTGNMVSFADVGVPESAAI